METNDIIIRGFKAVIDGEKSLSGSLEDLQGRLSLIGDTLNRIETTGRQLLQILDKIERHSLMIGGELPQLQETAKGIKDCSFINEQNIIRILNIMKGGNDGEENSANADN